MKVIPNNHIHSDIFRDMKRFGGLWVDTSSTAMSAGTTSVLKDLKHRNACVGLASNNLELAGNGKPNCRQQQYALDLVDKSRHRSAPWAHDLVEVSSPTNQNRFTPTLSEKVVQVVRVEVCVSEGEEHVAMGMRALFAS